MHGLRVGAAGLPIDLLSVLKRSDSGARMIVVLVLCHRGGGVVATHVGAHVRRTWCRAECGPKYHVCVATTSTTQLSPRGVVVGSFLCLSWCYILVH